MLFPMPVSVTPYLILYSQWLCFNYTSCFMQLGMRLVNLYLRRDPFD
jgi:hypothetical protein